MTYTAEHLFKLAVAFELIGCGLPAQTATTLVEELWNTICGAFGLTWLNGMVAYRQRPIFLRFIIRSLADIQYPDRAGSTEAGSAVVEDMDHLKYVMEFDIERSSFCSPVIPAHLMFKSLLDTAARVAGKANADKDAEFEAWIPKGKVESYWFKEQYPDVRNVEMRAYMCDMFGHDRAFDSPEEVEKTRKFSNRLQSAKDLWWRGGNQS